jgi:hypothetical protein
MMRSSLPRLRSEKVAKISGATVEVRNDVLVRNSYDVKRVRLLGPSRRFSGA